MAHQPNEQQALAINEFDADLLVSAGAGTGKTSVLTSKYLKLLEERRAEVNQIVAITFTKKAAAEMSSRIGQSIREYAEQAVDPDEVVFWQEQLRKAENARISTFHSLCLGLIREHPVEAGLSPATGVLDDGEESLLLNETIANTLTECIREQQLDTRLLSQLLYEYGWDSFVANLGGLYRAIRESGNSFGAVAELTLASLQKALDGNPMRTETLDEEIRELLEFAASQKKLTDRALTLLGNMRQNWPEYRATLEQSGDLEERLAVLVQVKKDLPKNLPACLKDRVEEVHRLADLLAAQYLDWEAAPRVKLIMAVLERIDSHFTAAKLEAGRVDFTDQQLLARDLLRNHPQLAEEVRQGISYIMVDEFQDTNSLQLELIELLKGEGYPGGRLMAVGDIKQSIYRFRGAEAGVILNLAERLSGGAGRIIPLTRNYRSNRQVIEFVNRLSQSLFAGEAFSYEPLEAHHLDLDSKIELVCCGDADLPRQARMTARRIARLVRESQTTDTPVNYKDIVILFRASTAMPLFQQALQELGIPYYASGGGEFYRRQEVVDQINLLRLVHQRYDEVALVALLLSPFAGLREESLFWLSHERPLIEAFYHLTAPDRRISVAEQQRLLRFRELILFLQDNRELLDIPGIIRLALERLDYREMLWSMPNAGQRLANLEKLLLKADEFADKGYHSLAAFLTYIRELEALDVVESEAQTQAEESDVVRLMTIHRSKGLEFPVVILPDLDRRFNAAGSERLVFHKEVGIGFKIPLENVEDGETTLWNRIKASNKMEELAELKRVLYVALTRAKRQLIMVGSGAGDAKSVSSLVEASDWMRWFKLLLPPLDEVLEVLDFHGVPVRIVREIPEEAPPLQRHSLLELYAERFDAPINQAQPEVAAVVNPVTPVINLKVSGILTFKECPRRFYLRYQLKLPEKAVRVPSEAAGESGPADASGTQIGIFLHQAVRLGDTWPEELWQRTFGSLETGKAGRLKEDLALMWENYRRSEFNSRENECWDEVPFQLKLDANFRVEGRFDRLLKNGRGELVLVDYKTHRASRNRVLQVAPHYFWQLQLYALAIEAVWGRKPDRAVLYFPYSNSPVAVPLDQAALETTVREVRTIGQTITHRRQLHDFPLAEVEKCATCPYSWFCRK